MPEATCRTEPGNGSLKQNEFSISGTGLHSYETHSWNGSPFALFVCARAVDQALFVQDLDLRSCDWAWCWGGGVG